MDSFIKEIYDFCDREECHENVMVTDVMVLLVQENKIGYEKFNKYIYTDEDEQKLINSLGEK